MAGSAGNLAEMSGRMLERGALRHTPAGIPVVEFKVSHLSRQVEAGLLRTVECELQCVAIGQMAQVMADSKPGDHLTVTGFLAARSQNRPSLVLHVNKIEFMEGNENGFQTEN